MVFSDLFFIFVFLPAVMVAYLTAWYIDVKMLSNSSEKSLWMRNLTLVVFSLIFYAWGEPMYVFLMLVCVFINYLAGRTIHAQEKPGARKAALVAGLICNIAILATFKYAGFLAEQLVNIGIPVQIPKIALPIGISFYTFQSISYLVDVYRRESPVQRKLVDLLLYISMFPQLIAGPIVRYGTVADEINERHVSAKDFADGAFRFFIGLGKKVIIANQLSEISDQFLVDGLSSLTTGGAWVGIVAFTLQIYYDFSGYSDMAIGIGRCLGFHFNENFNHPYCCNSITDFWRRWHMSLGSFFRDYVYIPMGGNRRHQPINILVVWFLTGMWHGASWNFIIWGVYFGVIVMLEKYTVLKLRYKYFALPLHVYSLLLVIIGWGIFYFDDFDAMVRFFQSFFCIMPGTDEFVSKTAVTGNFWLFMTALLFCLPLRKWADMVLDLIAKPEGTFHHSVVLLSRTAVTVCILFLSVALLVGATNNAFLYTRF